MLGSLFDKVKKKNDFKKKNPFKKVTPTQVFSSEYSKILRTHFEKHLQTTTSVNSRAAVFQESLALPFKRNVLTSGICDFGELV